MKYLAHYRRVNFSGEGQLWDSAQLGEWYRTKHGYLPAGSYGSHGLSEIWSCWECSQAGSSLPLSWFSCSVMSNSSWPHRLQQHKAPLSPLSLRVCSNSCPLSRWCHPTILSSVTPFSSCPQSDLFLASGSFPVSCLFTSDGKSIGASASASVLSTEYSALISLRIPWFDLLAVQGTLRSLL